MSLVEVILQQYPSMEEDDSHPHSHHASPSSSKPKRKILCSHTCGCVSKSQPVLIYRHSATSNNIGVHERNENLHPKCHSTCDYIQKRERKSKPSQSFSTVDQLENQSSTEDAANISSSEASSLQNPPSASSSSSSSDPSFVSTSQHHSFTY